MMNHYQRDEELRHSSQQTALGVSFSNYRLPYLLLVATDYTDSKGDLDIRSRGS
jgi:hypothetical protein